MSSNNAPFRIAIRQEGKVVNAYIAPMGTMEGALLLGSMSLAICRMDGQAFEDFKALASAFVERYIAGETGTMPSMEVSPAPEHEKGGHG